MRLADLKRFAPGGRASILKALADNWDVVEKGGIHGPKRITHFLAQLAHESGGFRYDKEIASGAAYEGRRNLGNTQKGDGVRFKGRGLIQITGRANYAAAGKALNLPLTNKPELACEPRNMVRIAVWYWTTRKLNRYADANDIRQITKRINGGYNGLADRRAWFRKAVTIWGAGEVDDAGKPFVESRTIVAAGAGTTAITASAISEYAYTGSTVVQTGQDVSEAFGLSMLEICLIVGVLSLIGYIVWDRWFIRKYERL
jgi:predicted chitinase